MSRTNTYVERHPLAGRHGVDRTEGITFAVVEEKSRKSGSLQDRNRYEKTDKGEQTETSQADRMSDRMTEQLASCRKIQKAFENRGQGVRILDESFSRSLLLCLSCLVREHNTKSC